MMKRLTLHVMSLGHTSIEAATLKDDAGDLAARASEGSEEAFRLIFEQHHRFILRFIYAMVGESVLAEELTQETFLRAYRNLATFKNEGKLSTWLCGIAKNVVRHSLRARRYKGGQLDIADKALAQMADVERPTVEDELLGKELREVIHEALAAMNEDYRLVFTLKVLQQRSYEEVAAITGFSIAKVKTGVHRAKAEVRARLRPYMEGSHEVS